MEIKCPNCGFSKDIPEEKIPKNAQIATCPKCSHKFRFRKIYFEEPKIDQNETIEEAENNKKDIWASLEKLNEDSEKGDGSSFDYFNKQDSVPWEHLEEKGFFGGFFQTVKSACLSPKEFFQKMSPEGDFLRPLIFYLLISEFYTAFGMFWKIVGLSIAMKNYQEPFALLGLHGLSSLLLLILYPIFLTVGLFVGAGINHLCLLAVKDGSKGFKGTFKVLCYASAPMIFSIIPYIGSLIGFVWSGILTFIGFKYVHNTSTLKVIIALSIPIVIMFLLSLTITSTLMMGK